MNSQKLFDVLKEKKIDAIICESPQTRRWYTGVSTTDGWLIIESNKEATLFVDGRYIEYAKNNAKNVKVNLLKKDSLQKWLLSKNFKKIAIEDNYLTLSKRDYLKKIFTGTKVTFTSINAQMFRIVKSEDEIKLVQKAIDISLESFEVLKSYIKEGVTEKELQHKLEYIMVRKGAEREAFDSIVAFNDSTAEPHHHSSDKKLKKGDMVTIDFGAQYDGYCADITRTFIYENQGNEKFNEILSIVEEAARLGREAVKPGIKASEIDKVCRSFIKSKGYDNFFVHSTGHGLGIDVHEFPYVSTTSDIVLEPGMIITVEPGIYIEKLGGARIEDDVLVTKDGNKVLTRK